MVAKSIGSTFDLDSSETRDADKNVRVSRIILGLGAVIFSAITVYGAAGLPRALSDSSDAGAYLFGLILIAFFTIFTASSAIIALGKSASQLSLTDETVILRFASRRHPKVLRWSDPNFRIIVRDFRGHSTPMANRVQIERIGRAPFWLNGPTSPLTPASFDALIDFAKAKGLAVTLKKGGTKFNFWPNTEITIRRATSLGQN